MQGSAVCCWGVKPMGGVSPGGVVVLIRPNLKVQVRVRVAASLVGGILWRLLVHGDHPLRTGLRKLLGDTVQLTLQVTLGLGPTLCSSCVIRERRTVRCGPFLRAHDDGRRCAFLVGREHSHRHHPANHIKALGHQSQGVLPTCS